MLKISTACFLGFVLLIGVEIGLAGAGEVTFKMTNKARYAIIIKFFSQNRHWVWPGPTTHYILDDDAEHDFPLACRNGEKICFGGSYNSNDRPRYWGLGLHGDKGCKNCCLTCADNVWHGWVLSE